MTVMDYPVMLSSGVVMERTSLFNENGRLRYKECPYTKKELKDKVYRVLMLEQKIITW